MSKSKRKRDARALEALAQFEVRTLGDLAAKVQLWRSNSKLKERDLDGAFLSSVEFDLARFVDEQGPQLTGDFDRSGEERPLIYRLPESFELLKLSVRDLTYLAETLRAADSVVCGYLQDYKGRDAQNRSGRLTRLLERQSQEILACADAICAAVRAMPAASPDELVQGLRFYLAEHGQDMECARFHADDFCRDWCAEKLSAAKMSKAQ